MPVNPNLHQIGAITPYATQEAGKPEQGWMTLEELTKMFVETASGTRLQTQKRTCLLSGSIEDLQYMVRAWALAGGVDGKLWIDEKTYGQLPVSFIKNCRDLSQYEKIAGDTKIPCALKGEQIYRFTKYDPTGEKADVLVAHDNGESIRNVVAQQVAAKKALAAMPATATVAAAVSFDVPAAGTVAPVTANGVVSEPVITEAVTEEANIAVEASL